MNTKVVIWFLSLALNRSYAYVLPKWSDIFSSLEPYKDEETLMLEEMEDNGEPRIGFVQLNSGSTTYNATLNLTGHILLGLGIASSLLLYMFFNAFDSAGDSGGYSEESSGYGFFNRRSKLNTGSTTYNSTLNLTGPILLGLGIASSLLMYMFFNAFGASNNDYGGGYGDGFFRNHFKKLPTSGFNATINLSGPIILGLGIASSLLLYMFFSAFNQRDYHQLYSRYGAYIVQKRSIEEEAELTFMVGDAIDQYTLSENAGNFCKEKLMCEAVKLYSNHHQSTEKNPIKTLKDVLHREFSLLDSISQNHTRKKCQDGIPRDCPLEMQAIKAILATPLT